MSVRVKKHQLSWRLVCEASARGVVAEMDSPTKPPGVLIAVAQTFKRYRENDLFAGVLEHHRYLWRFLLTIEQPTDATLSRLKGILGHSFTLIRDPFPPSESSTPSPPKTLRNNPFCVRP